VQAAPCVQAHCTVSYTPSADRASPAGHCAVDSLEGFPELADGHAAELATPGASPRSSTAAANGAGSAASTPRQNRQHRRRSLSRRGSETAEERSARRRARTDRFFAQLRSLSRSMRRQEAAEPPASPHHGACMSPLFQKNHPPPLKGLLSCTSAQGPAVYWGSSEAYRDGQLHRRASPDVLQLSG
jgi:hypothetical protein